MSNQHANSELYIGVDVGKFELVIYEASRARPFQCPNNPKAIKDAFAPYQNSSVFVVCEATGGYENALLGQLCAMGIRVHRADTLRVKAFIRSFGRLGKSDTIDAKALALYGQKRREHLSLWQVPQQKRAILQSLVQRRDDLVQMQTAETNRQKAPNLAQPLIKASTQAMLDTIKKQIKAIDRDIQQIINQDSRFKEHRRIMTQLPGIGTLTAHKLLAYLPELGTLTRKQIASLAGLAPHPNDSGTRNRYRPVRGGRPHVRKTLFMPALAATRPKSDNPLVQKYRTLVQNGKPKLVALTAIMRKIIVILNAKIRDHYKASEQS